MSFWSNVGRFFAGSKGKFEQRSALGKEQQPLYQQLLASAQGQGAGGAFGQSADYYRDLLSNNPEAFEAFAAPEKRQFNEEIIPGLAEQYAGMGAGGLSSSSFRNAAVQAGSSLSERLAALRAGLRQQGAQGLQNIGQSGLGQFNQNIYRPSEEGLLQTGARATGQALGTAGSMFIGGKMGAPQTLPNRQQQPPPDQGVNSWSRGTT
jgi:hypothetical protein